MQRKWGCKTPWLGAADRRGSQRVGLALINHFRSIIPPSCTCEVSCESQSTEIPSACKTHFNSPELKMWSPWSLRLRCTSISFVRNTPVFHSVEHIYVPRKCACLEHDPCSSKTPFRRHHCPWPKKTNSTGSFHGQSLTKRTLHCPAGRSRTLQQR